MQSSLNFTSDSILGGRSLQRFGIKHFSHILISLSREQEERGQELNSPVPSST